MDLDDDAVTLERNAQHGAIVATRPDGAALGRRPSKGRGASKESARSAASQATATSAQNSEYIGGGHTRPLLRIPPHLRRLRPLYTPLTLLTLVLLLLYLLTGYVTTLVVFLETTEPAVLTKEYPDRPGFRTPPTTALTDVE